MNEEVFPNLSKMANVLFVQIKKKQKKKQLVDNFGVDGVGCLSP